MIPNTSWRKIFTNIGKVYYHNTQTGQTTWDKPVEVIQYEESQQQQPLSRTQSTGKTVITEQSVSQIQIGVVEKVKSNEKPKEPPYDGLVPSYTDYKPPQTPFTSISNITSLPPEIPQRPSQPPSLPPSQPVQSSNPPPIPGRPLSPSPHSSPSQPPSLPPRDTSEPTQRKVPQQQSIPTQKPVVPQQKSPSSMPTNPQKVLPTGKLVTPSQPQIKQIPLTTDPIPSKNIRVLHGLRQVQLVVQPNTPFQTIQQQIIDAFCLKEPIRLLISKVDHRQVLLNNQFFSSINDGEDLRTENIRSLWFYPNVDRASAEGILRSCIGSAFLVRESDGGRCAVSCVNRKKAGNHFIIHWKIIPTSQGLILDKSNDPNVYDSLESLVDKSPLLIDYEPVGKYL